MDLDPDTLAIVDRLIQLAVVHKLGDHDRSSIVATAVRALAATTGVPPHDDPSASEWLAFPHFTRAAGLAGTFDLKTRIVANNAALLTAPAERAANVRASLHGRLEDVVKAVVDFYAAMNIGSDDERERLTKIAVLRNKVLHAALDSASGHVQSLGEELRALRVTGFNLETGKVFTMPGKPIDRTSLYGWLFEACQSGALEAASKLFREGLDILTRWQEAALAR